MTEEQASALNGLIAAMPQLQSELEATQTALATTRAELAEAQNELATLRVNMQADTAALQGEVKGVNLDRSFPQRVARDDYGPFRFAAQGRPQTEAQKYAQENRQDSSYPFHNYAKIRWLEAMNLESYWE